MINRSITQLETVRLALVDVDGAHGRSPAGRSGPLRNLRACAWSSRCLRLVRIAILCTFLLVARALHRPMGFFKLLHRGTGHSLPNEGSEPAETSKKRDKQDEGSTKTSVASNQKATAGSAAARSNAVQDTPPRIDWELRRRLPTQLITLDLGGVDAPDAPWVDVAREADSSPSSGSLGFSAALHAASSSERTVNPRLAQILDGYKLDVEQCTVLVSACTRVIAEQGRMSCPSSFSTCLMQIAFAQDWTHLVSSDPGELQNHAIRSARL